MTTPPAPPDQAPARPDDLARRLPDPHSSSTSLLGDWLHTLSTVVRTFVLATIAVPIVIYGLMPQLHRLRGRLLTRQMSSS